MDGDTGLWYQLSPYGLNLDKSTDGVSGEQSREDHLGFSNQEDRRMENRSRVLYCPILYILFWRR